MKHYPPEEMAEVREMIQAALGNGADQWAWQPGERWQDAAVRVIQQAREWREEVAPHIKHDQDLDKDWCPACRLGRALKGEE